MNLRITTSVKQTVHVVADNLRVAEILTAVLMPLVALAALLGLVVPTIYHRNPAPIIPALRGQDLITLVALPVLGVALYGVRRGSARATLLWIGLLGYMFYTYTGAALGYAFAELTPLYIVLFSGTVFALVAGVSNINAADLGRSIDADAPRRAVAGFLVLIGLMLAALELGQIVQYLASGVLPSGVVAAGGGPYFVYSLDLGLVLPLTLLGARWLWQRRPWGYVLAGYLLIKTTTMGLALLAMNWFTIWDGQVPDPAELLGFYAILALGGMGMSMWFFRHCGHQANSDSLSKRSQS